MSDHEYNKIYNQSMFQITTIACGKGPHIGIEHWGTISYAAAQFKDRNLLLNPIPSTIEALNFFFTRTK
jgi:hypothetical protein